MHYFIILFCETFRSWHTSLSCNVDNKKYTTLFQHMVSTILFCMSHPCRFILSSSHLLPCSMEDNPYLVDMCLVLGLINMLIPMYLRGLYIQELLVYFFITISHTEQSNLLGHTLINWSYPFLVYSCACVWVLSSWVNFLSDKFLHGSNPFLQILIKLWYVIWNLCPP